ncbi:MAG: hypothetical protein U0892_12810 [Pirellulales bacterium]
MPSGRRSGAGSKTTSGSWGLAGYPIREVRRAIQKGQPQMTIADLIGSLPADIVKAQSLDQIGMCWHKWLSMRVKIIDEYNRIDALNRLCALMAATTVFGLR